MLDKWAMEIEQQTSQIANSACQSRLTDSMIDYETREVEHRRLESEVKEQNDEIEEKIAELAVAEAVLEEEEAKDEVTSNL